MAGVYVFSWFTQLGLRIELLGAIRYEFILGLFLTLGAFFQLSSQKIYKSDRPLVSISVLYILYMALFVVLSVDVLYSWNIYLNRAFKFSLMALFVAVFIDTVPKLKFVLFCYFLAALKAGQEGFLGWLSGSLVWENQGINRLHGSISMYEHPNNFGGFAVCLFPFIYNFFPVVNKPMKIGLICLGVFGLVILLFAGSRTGYVAFALLVLYVLGKRFKRGFFGAFFLASILMLVSLNFIPDEYKGRFESIFTQKEAEGSSANTRKQIIYDAIDVFIEHPMGVGIGAFPKVRIEMFGEFQDTHNLYLEVLTNMGFIGLLIFYLFVKRIINANRHTLSRLSDIDTPDAKFIIACGNAVIAYIAARLILGMFGMDMYEIYWWWAIGLTLACCNIAYKIYDSQHR
ncbi:hypothetical protein BST96_10515 [Oceanicoccus sagamiensis]|uniref:O-antigen ligase-related domain-containing protein n=2 Tax=Oceanicoccus sagamiensis TaxID=716816 RepID=A0A1X9NKN4_9GAMM|nr:hypothetical protein BST96_10515 [Oceanicoccus sagamiensis]